ncbi:Uncharacterized protein SCF082_LOCUS32880 [Durusdinium trenchii]
MFEFDFEELEAGEVQQAQQASAKAKVVSPKPSAKEEEEGRRYVSGPPPGEKWPPPKAEAKGDQGARCKDASTQRGPSPPSASSNPSATPSAEAPSMSRHEQRIRHWLRTAEQLVRMLQEMQSKEFLEGKGWMEGMQRLIEGTPKDHAGRKYGLDEFAGPLLRDHFIQWTADHSRAVNFRKIILRMEMKVVVATKHLDLGYDWTLRKGSFGAETRKMAQQLGATEEPPFDGFMHMKRGLLFVGLPLRLYLADSPHLYELVRRLRRLEQLEKPVEAESIRAVLDAEDLPYSVLVYAMLAALQALHAARLTGKRAGTGAQGLDAFCATARRSDGLEIFEVKEVDEHSPLIFRGIWVPKRIDEHKACYTWSFNSFSRSVEGVLWVLDFYAVEATGNTSVSQLAWGDSHVLLYVARFAAASSRWAFPVQFFNSGMAADIEKELVVLPFVEYEFEFLQGCMWEVRSSMSEAVKWCCLRQIEQRWKISFAKDAPQLLELLEGRGCKAYPGLNRQVKVTVRFIKAIKPCKPIFDLMEKAHRPPEELMLAFPPKDPEAAKDATSIFGAGYAALNGMVDPGHVKPLGTWIPGQKIAAGL